MPGRPSLYRRVTSALGLALISGGIAPGCGPVAAQDVAKHQAPQPRLHVTDGRLAAALRDLAAASPSAAWVMDALSTSGLEVAVGTPAELAALPDSEGGPAPGERSALLADPSGNPSPDEPPIAWVVFRVSAPLPDAPAQALGTVDRVWVAIEADSVEVWIRNDGGTDVDWRIHQDFLAILAHEFVAHVGSIAATRRLEDFCDDPLTGAEVADSREMSCSIRVENQVRRELNQALGLKGDRALPRRTDYSLEVMNFARAHLAQIERGGM